MWRPDVTHDFRPARAASGPFSHPYQSSAADTSRSSVRCLPLVSGHIQTKITTSTEKNMVLTIMGKA